MLVLTREPEERIFIVLPSGQTITIQVTRVKGDKVGVGLIAPRSYRIYRDDNVEPRAIERLDAKLSSLIDAVTGIESAMSIKIAELESSLYSLDERADRMQQEIDNRGP